MLYFFTLIMKYQKQKLPSLKLHQKIKYPGIKTKEIKDLDTENYKTLIKKI